MAADPFRPDGVSGRSSQELRPEEAGASAPAPAAGPDVPRPRGVGELLDASLDAYVARFVPLVAFASLLWLPFHLVDRLAARLDAGTQLVIDLGLGAGAAWGVQSFGVAVIAVLVHDHLAGEPRPVRAVLGQVARRLLPLLLLTAITTVGVMLGTLACILPGFVANWLFAVVIAVLILERRRPLEALRRGVGLMTHDSAASFLRWLGLFTVGSLLLLPIAAVPGLFDHPDTRFEIEQALPLSPLMLDVLDVVVSSLFGGVAQAFSGVWVTLLYVDACARSDGADLRERLERQARVHGGGAAA